VRNRRWSDHDKHFWPLTLSTGDHSRLGFMFDSGANDGGAGDCHVRLYLWTVTLICELPKIIRDHRVRHSAKSWSDEDLARIGRDWYEEVFPREYGAYVSDGTLHVHYGAQTHDSRTDMNKCFFLPWRNWRFIRMSFFDLEGRHFWTERDNERAAWEASTAVKAACPKAKFEFEDYDGQKIQATTHIEEREWRFGTGLFRWLSWLSRPKVKRTLSIEFNAEVGPEKGSWKGGTVGTSVEMVAGETAETAFQRYCEQEHRSKYRRYRVRYVGKAA
jgi:hypothetical protein